MDQADGPAPATDGDSHLSVEQLLAGSSAEDAIDFALVLFAEENDWEARDFLVAWRDRSRFMPTDIAHEFHNWRIYANRDARVTAEP
jgi:hypothetical protein